MTPEPTIPAPAPRALPALDLRSLALFRVGLASILLCDALARLTQAGLLYSDHGLLARSLAVQWIEPASLSLHLANGGMMFALLLGALQVLAAGALLVGWHARRAAPLLWLLCISAFARNPAVVTAAETLALMLLSLGLFLPWHTRWAVDAAGAHSHADPAHRSWPGALLLLQCAALPALLALAAAPDALATLLESEQAHVPGSWLTRWPSLLVPLTQALGVLAGLVLLLAVVPWAQPLARRAALLAYLALCTLALLSAPFSGLLWLALCSAALLIDGGLWQRIAGAATAAPLRIYHDQNDAGGRHLAMLICEFLCLPNALVLPAQDSPRVARLVGAQTRLILIDRDDKAYLDAEAVAQLLRRAPLLRPVRALLGVAGANPLSRMLFALASRLRAPSPAPARRLEPSLTTRPRHTALAILLGALLGLAQLGAAGVLPASLTTVLRAPLIPLALARTWIDQLHVAQPARSWIAAIGTLEGGEEVDALSSELSAARFDVRHLTLLTKGHARSYERALREHAIPRQALAQYLCERHASRLSGLRLVLLVQEPEAATAEQRVLLRHDCRVSP